MEKLEKTAKKNKLIVVKVDEAMQDDIAKLMAENNWNQSAFIREAIRNALVQVAEGKW